MAEIKRIPAIEFEVILGKTNFLREKLIKDYYLTLILYLIKEVDGIYFKGGNALNKIFLNHARLSEDLDFSLTRDVLDAKKEIVELIKKSEREKLKEILTKSKDKEAKEILNKIKNEKRLKYVEERKDIRALLRQAFKEKKKVKIRYYSLSSDEVRWRLVSIYKTGSDFIIAFCHLRNEERTFVTDRISKAAMLDENYKIPNGWEPESIVY